MKVIFNIPQKVVDAAKSTLFMQCEGNDEEKINEAAKMDEITVREELFKDDELKTVLFYLAVTAIASEVSK